MFKLFLQLFWLMPFIIFQLLCHTTSFLISLSLLWPVGSMIFVLLSSIDLRIISYLCLFLETVEESRTVFHSLDLAQSSRLFLHLVTTFYEVLFSSFLNVPQGGSNPKINEYKALQ